MIEPISTVLPEIAIHNNRAVTTSIAVANYFGKMHKHVLQKIRSLECTPTFTTANFSAVVITTKAGFDDREVEAFEMTKNGFIFLVMGFTGKRAARFKEAYISEFDRMEAELLKHATPPAQPTMPFLPAGVEFDLRVRGSDGAVTSVQVINPGYQLVHPSDAGEMLQRNGFVICHHKELRSAQIDHVGEMCDEAAKLEAEWMLRNRKRYLAA